MTTLSSRELNQDIDRAKEAAKAGPVIITDGDKPSLVLLSFEEYQKITELPRQLAGALGDTRTETEATHPQHVTALSLVRELLSTMQEVREAVREGRHKVHP
ncbi:MAG: type II toxin-antitoxin system Phd/YefM family antitoxin [Burkholderiaceae bacterium]|nr:type II toxin-antitoxin system Phd/YefM family antitoxin [Burkholderiaceae bacterium]